MTLSADEWPCVYRRTVTVVYEVEPYMTQLDALLGNFKPKGGRQMERERERGRVRDRKREKEREPPPPSSHDHWRF